MIKIENLTKTYSNGVKKAVDNLTLEINNGEIFGFLGPNGAGKSTTIKCFTGILPFDSGSISINGYDLKKESLNAKKSIGFVPDEHIMYEGLTGIEYLNFVADIFEVSPIDRKERVEKFATLFKLTDALKTKISGYSHGMKQKLSIISALIHDPDIWVLDEPMTGLDPQSVFDLKQLMTEHIQQGKIVFFSSHVLDVVEKICTKVAIINKGSLVGVFSMEELNERKGDVSLEELFLNLTQNGDNNASI